MAGAHKLVVDLTGNDELKGYLTAKGPGDSCDFEVTATLDDATTDRAVFSIKEITAIKPEEDLLPESDFETGKDAPIMEVFGKSGERS